MPFLHPTNLTPKERRFLDNVAMGMDLNAAVLAAGYTQGTHHAKEALKKRDVVQRELAKIYKAARRKANVTRDEVLEGFKDAINDAKLAGEPATQIKGWTEIGKMCGFYAPEKKEIKVSADMSELQARISDLSVEELLEIAGQDTLEVIEGSCEHVEE